MQIKDDPSLKWPEKMKGDPNKRNRNKYCRFHRESYKVGKIEEFPWTRPQGQEI